MDPVQHEEGEEHKAGLFACLPGDPLRDSSRHLEHQWASRNQTDGEGILFPSRKRRDSPSSALRKEYPGNLLILPGDRKCPGPSTDLFSLRSFFRPLRNPQPNTSSKLPIELTSSMEINLLIYRISSHWPISISSPRLNSLTPLEDLSKDGPRPSPNDKNPMLRELIEGKSPFVINLLGKPMPEKGEGHWFSIAIRRKASPGIIALYLNASR